jgi:peptidoglycan/LPS O-acetylase OafA/YrhL
MRRPPRLATWLLDRAVPDPDREVLIGDLVEEHALCAAADPGAAGRWYWNQVLRTLTSLLWASARRGHWLKTLGAVLVAYLVVTLIVMAGDLAMSRLPTTNVQVYSVLSLAVGFPAMILGGYLAARMRRRAAGKLAVLAAVLGVVSLAATGDQAPIWYQLLLIVVGPVGALLGGRLRKRKTIPPSPTLPRHPPQEIRTPPPPFPGDPVSYRPEKRA